MMKPAGVLGRERNGYRPLLEVLDSFSKVLKKHVGEIAADTLPDQNTLNDDVLAVGW